VIRFIAAVCLPLVLVAQEPWNRGEDGKLVPLRVEYQAKNYSSLVGMPGFSKEALELHFTLYQGYVKNTNLMLSLMDQLSTAGKLGSPEWAGLRRRFGWEWDGMRLHEFYFDSLGGDGVIDTGSDLYRAMVKQWGSYDAWRQDFEATGMMRGIGWAILYQDPETGMLINTWINEHDLGHLAGAKPILNMDVFEHAYMLDYGLNRKGYIDAFFNNLKWNEVSKRYQQQSPHSRS
jgi:superoxide dismutase, Fe-Mn family